MRQRLYLLVLFLAAAFPGVCALWRIATQAPPAHVLGTAQNYAVPIGDAGAAPSMCGTYPGHLDPLCLGGAVCSNGQFLGGQDGSWGCGVPVGDGATVPSAVYSPDLKNAGSVTVVVGLTGSDAAGGALPIQTGDQNLQWAANASPQLSQLAAVDGGGTTMYAKPQVCTNTGSSADLAVTVGGPCSGGSNAGMTLTDLTNGEVWQFRYGALFGFPAIYPENVTPGTVNFTLAGTTTASWLNAPNAAGSDFLAVVGSPVLGASSTALSSYVNTFQYLNSVTAPVFGVQAKGGDVAPVDLVVYGQDAYASASSHTSGGNTYVLGGALVGAGTAGPVRIGVNHDKTKTLIEAAAVSGRYVTTFNQVGSGTAALTDGSGASLFYKAQTNVATCPSVGFALWADSSTGAAYVCNPGGSPTALGGAGSCSLGGDVTGSCGSNDVTTITGNGSGVVSVVANNFAYAGGGLLQWTSNGQVEIQATGGNAYFTSNFVTTLSGASAFVDATGAVGISSGSTLTDTATTAWLDIVGGNTMISVTPSATLVNAFSGTLTLANSGSGNMLLETIGSGAIVISASSAQASIGGSTTLISATNQTTVSAGTSLYLNAGSGQYIHEQIFGVDQLTLDSSGEINLANCTSGNGCLTAALTGSTTVAKPTGMVTFKIGGTPHSFYYY
jgi:hypothetical protein